MNCLQKPPMTPRCLHLAELTLMRIHSSPLLSRERNLRILTIRKGFFFTTIKAKDFTSKIILIRKINVSPKHVKSKMINKCPCRCARRCLMRRRSTKGWIRIEIRICCEILIIQSIRIHNMENFQCSRRNC